MDNRLTLLELNALVRRSIEQCLPDEYWVQAELSEVHPHSNGHCYLEFVQKAANGLQTLAKARGIIWNNVFAVLKPYFEKNTGQAFAAGIKVLVKVSVGFHEVYGYSLTVSDIDPSYTLGDMARQRREIIRQLTEEGVIDLNKELPMPVLPQRIAVISSATAAGYGDFCHQLEHNTRGFFFHTELFPAVMQGAQVEASLLAALDRINARQDEFDVVVIFRGGGATSELASFDTYLLAAACAQFPLPIITGIGHERDDTVIDMVAHTRVKTPTAAAELLTGLVGAAADRLDLLRDRLHQGVTTLVATERERLTTLRSRIPSMVQRQLHNALLAVVMRDRDLRRSVSQFVVAQQHKLTLISHRIADASPERLLARGYSLTLKDGHAVTDVSALKAGDRLLTRVKNGEFSSVVIDL
jgi:exodeoxyribonuclease VII large subunit